VYNGTETEVAVHRSYDSFGKVTSEVNPESVDVVFGFTGRAYDEATGLQNNLNRWYDANVGRWISEDPVGFAVEDANVYRYVGNSAIAYVDTDGLLKIKIQLQNKHIPGTKENEAANRNADRKKERRPSVWNCDYEKSVEYTNETWENPDSVVPRADGNEIRRKKFPKPVGTGPNGQDLYWVTVHGANQNTAGHGLPSGPTITHQ
jgi:RHS repeat-associated protein